MKNLQKFSNTKLTEQELQQLKGGARRRVRRAGVAMRRRRSSG